MSATSQEVEIGQSVQALYINALQKAREGYFVRSGLSVSINTGTLGQSDTLQVATGDFVWGGTEQAKGATEDVQIDAADPDNPRKDVVYISASSGTASVAKGTAESTPADQPGASRFEYYEPEPDELYGTEAVVLAEVWVPAGNSSITDSDLADRRVFETVSSVMASQSITLSGGSDPAADVTVADVASDQLHDFHVIVTPDADPGFNADYAFNYDYGRQWDDSDGAVDVPVTVTWDTDPGGGNDVSATIYVVHQDL